MNKIIITLTKDQVNNSLSHTAGQLVCSGSQFLKHPVVRIKEDGSAEVEAELTHQVSSGDPWD